MAGEDPPQEMRAVVLHLLMMRAMQAEVVAAAMTAAMTAAVSAAGGRFADHCDGCDHGHDQCHGDAKTARWPLRWNRVKVMGGGMRHGTVGVGVETERPARANTTGRAFITICLHVRVGGVADVDVAVEPRAPHPAGRVSAVIEVAEVTVTVVAVMAVMTVMTTVMTVMAAVMTTVMAMTATVAAAGVRVSGGRKRDDRQRDSGDSGSEERTLHGYFSWVCSRATIALGDAH